MYLDAMQEIYSGVNKVFIDSRAAGNLLYLPIDKLMQSAGAQAAAAPGPAAQAPAPAPAAQAPAADARTRDNARSRERETR